MSLDADFHGNKTVAILGAGQTAFQCAKVTHGKTGTTVMSHHNSPSLLWSAPHAGCPRAINDELLDAHQHELLDALVQLNDHGDDQWSKSSSKRNNGKSFHHGLEARLGTVLDDESFRF